MTSQGIATVSLTFNGEVSRSGVMDFLMGREVYGLYVSKYCIDREVFGEAVSITFYEGVRYTDEDMNKMADEMLRALREERREKRGKKTGRERR